MLRLPGEIGPARGPKSNPRQSACNTASFYYPLVIVEDGSILWAKAQSKDMAALTLSEIPSNINTYERLLTWAAQCCQSIANGQQVSVVVNQAALPTAQVQVAVTADNTDRFIVTCYMPLDRDALNDPDQKTWMATKDIGTNQPNENLLSN